MDGFHYEGHRLIVEKAGMKYNDKRGIGPQEEDKCFKCGKFGHWYQLMGYVYFLGLMNVGKIIKVKKEQREEII